MSDKLSRVDHLAGFRYLFHHKSATNSPFRSIVLVLCSLLLLPTAAEAVSTSTTAAATNSATTVLGSKSALVARQQQQDAPRSAKRGLIVVPDISSKDLQKFLNSSSSDSSDISWYYNYTPNPTSFLAESAPHLEFVPQLWGNYDTADTFASTVKGLLSSGSNIQSILAFNEPDACYSGGSCVDPAVAATLWQSQLAPLQEKPYSIQIGSPAVTGSPSGFTWLAEFFAACKGGCKPDFIAIHWYGNFEGLASHIGQVNATFLHNVTNGLWVTEFAESNVGLSDAQSFYNMSTQYMDRLPYIHRYSYFGAFRSSVSNIGPNSAMLDQNGDLTDIGSWYLGGSATGNIPKASSSPRQFSPTGVVLLTCSSLLVAFLVTYSY